MTPKQAGRATGPRTLNGAMLDVRMAARELGDTEKGIRAKIARGLLPHRRLGKRIVFVRAELDEFLRGLPGLSPQQALANQRARHS